MHECVEIIRITLHIACICVSTKIERIKTTLTSKTSPPLMLLMRLTLLLLPVLLKNDALLFLIMLLLHPNENLFAVAVTTKDNNKHAHEET